MSGFNRATNDDDMDPNGWVPPPKGQRPAKKNGLDTIMTKSNLSNLRPRRPI